ncbi:sensor histidine kinase [Paenibacillus chitinolyticus]|uniref:sensor histidine kinase n=1 Tax=Paenibacillus chitinolyticus TaxID=79263 RepID=UPI003649F139
MKYKNPSQNGSNSMPAEMPNAWVDARKRTVVWLVLVYFSIVLIQWTTRFQWIPSLFFTGLYLFHGSLYWHSDSFTKKRPWVYLVLQGLLVLWFVWFMPIAWTIVILGLFPVLMGQSAVIYHQYTKVAIACIYYHILAFFIIVKVNELPALVVFGPLLLLLNVIVTSYTRMFQREVYGRVHTQNFLRDLESAHQKVEELTLANERQRIARDLHDTLAQGLAGVLMQIEAMDAHLSKSNVERAQQILRQCRETARKTLAEARSAIDGLRLRSSTATEFSDSVREEADGFSSATGIPVELHVELLPHISKLMTEHVLQIVKECLMNIARHAEASRVGISISRAEDRIVIEIRDNGKGFDPASIGRQLGHYGLIGMKERVRILGGVLDISSASQQGTVVRLELPENREEAKHEL